MPRRQDRAKKTESSHWMLSVKALIQGFRTHTTLEGLGQWNYHFDVSPSETNLRSSFLLNFSYARLMPYLKPSIEYNFYLLISLTMRAITNLSRFKNIVLFTTFSLSIWFLPIIQDPNNFPILFFQEIFFNHPFPRDF